MLLIVGWDAERPRIFCHSQVDCRPGAVDPLFELAHAGEVFIELTPVGGAQSLGELSCVFADEIEDALVVPIAPGLVVAAVVFRPGYRRADRRPGGD